MGCCGEKRNQLKMEMEASSMNDLQTNAIEIEAPKEPWIFEYLGNRKLVVEGISTGNKYWFNNTGEKVEVNYSDAFALMAEGELRRVK